jgi:hypothetical protein
VQGHLRSWFPGASRASPGGERDVLSLPDAMRQLSCVRAVAHVEPQPDLGFARRGEASRPPLPAAPRQLSGARVTVLARVVPAHPGPCHAGSGIALSPPRCSQAAPAEWREPPLRGPLHPSTWRPALAALWSYARRGAATRPPLPTARRGPSGVRAVTHAHVMSRPVQGYALQGEASHPPRLAALRQPCSVRAVAPAHTVPQPDPGFAQWGAASRPPPLPCCFTSAKQREGRDSDAHVHVIARGVPAHRGLSCRLCPAGSGIAPPPIPVAPLQSSSTRAVAHVQAVSRPHSGV